MTRMLVAAAVLSLAATGQQQIDLKAAYDQGVISKSEYERKRKDILRKCGRLGPHALTHRWRCAA